MDKNGTKFWSSDVMPIGGFYGPIASCTKEKLDYKYTSLDFLKDEYFQLIKESGIHIITSTDNDYNTVPEDIHKTLQLCDKYQLQLFVHDSGITTDMTYGQICARMSEYNQYSSFAGICIVDEPTVDYFPMKLDGEQLLYSKPIRDYQELSCKINQIDDVVGYINLLPYYDWMGNNLQDYRRYLDEYCSTCNPRLLSYDYYPFDRESKDRNYKLYFGNLSVAREVAQKYDIPFWVYIQCGSQWSAWRTGKTSAAYYPEEGEFYWNVNTSLAMGAKGIQYFPLIQPHFYALSKDGLDIKRNGMIAADGTLTKWYGYAKTMNRFITVVDEFLMQAEHVGIIATNSAQAITEDVGCRQQGEGFRELQSIESQEAGVVIGCFTCHDKTLLYVVNNDMYAAQSIVLHYKDIYQITQMTVNNIQTVTADKTSIRLEAGEAVMLIIG